MIDVWQAIWIGLASMLGAAMQGAIGFAFGLLAIPLMVWAGVPMPLAVMAVLVMVVVQTSLNLWKMREHIDIRATKWLAVYRTVSMPVGVYLMGVLVDLGQDRVKQAIGILIAAVLIAQWALRVKPREKVHAGWTPVVGITSGAMSGMTGMGGPPLVIWVMAHDWSTQRARCFLWVCFLELMPLQIGLLLWKFGSEVAWGVPLALAYAPLVLGASILGAMAGSRLSHRRLRAAAFGVLAIIAVVSILAPWLD